METEPITLEGAKKLQDELSDLINNKRQKVIQAIAEAREHGDLNENAEYHAAKEEQGHIEGRIQQIQAMLANAEIVDVTKLNKSNLKVVFGSTINVTDLDDDNKIKFKIVGDDEADIEQNLISYKSPVARALIGKTKGDFVSVTTPKGEKSYEITKVIYK